MYYLTVGTDQILEDLWRPICDNESVNSMKPKGGLWLTEFDVELPSYNCWVDYMIMNPYVLFYRKRWNSPFLQPCSIVSLKSDAKIFLLNNMEQYEYLLQFFPDSNYGFSYSKLSECYDGVFVDMKSLLDSKMDLELLKKIASFGVNSLVLFDIGSIDYYYSGVVRIEPFDYEGSICLANIFYKIEWSLEKRSVSNNLPLKKARNRKGRDDKC